MRQDFPKLTFCESFFDIGATSGLHQKITLVTKQSSYAHK
jgi:hypothetical protein